MASSTGSLSFRSEVGLSFIAIVAVFVPVTGIAAWRMFTQGAIFPAAVVLLAWGLFAWLLFGTAYVLTEDHRLIVRSGPVRRTVNLASIRSIRPTTSMWSAPALSLNRLEIVTDGAPLVISPADRKRFLAELVRRAPDIKLT